MEVKSKDKDTDERYAQFDPLFAFGADKRAKPGMGVAYIDDNTVCFPVGSQLAMARADTHVMTFFPLLDRVTAINGVVTTGHDTPGSVIVGVIEEVATPATPEGAGGADTATATGKNVVHQVSVYKYDTKRRVRAFRIDHALTRGEVIGVSFSTDAQHVVIQYGDSVSFGSSHDPDYIAAYFSVATGKMMAWLKNDAKVEHVSIAPDADDLVATTGPRWLRVWRLQQSRSEGPRGMPSFKPVIVVNYDVRRDLPAGVELTCHAWLGASTRDKSMDRLALGMTSGEILVLSSRAAEGAVPAAAEGKGVQEKNIVFFNTLRIPAPDGLRTVPPPMLCIGEGAVIPGFTELWGSAGSGRGLRR